LSLRSYNGDIYEKSYLIPMELNVSNAVDLEAKLVKRKTQGWSHEALLNIVIVNKVELGDASKEGCIEVVRLLLENGADIHVQKDYSLRLASFYGHVEVVRLLLESGADVHADDDYALRLASFYGHVEVVRLLLASGANVHAKDDCALRWASDKGHIEVVDLLVSYGAKL
jgi:ankyrin repeat protein